MIKTFRIVGFLEGLSYLLLLGIGTPLKIITGNDILVKALGMPHGILFIAYLILAFVLYQKLDWSTKTFLQVLLGSILPFGTFYMDRKLFGQKVNQEY